LGLEQLPLQAPVPLTSTHLVTDFDCGVDSLNEWLGKRSWKNQLLGVSRTFVVCDGEIVIGYYCLSSAAIDRLELPKAKQRNMPITPKYPRLKSIKYLLNLSIHVKFAEFQFARLARDKILNNPESF
jgi:hypothetical protein